MIQSNQYYPFGMLFGESSNQDKQYYKYNGKELDQMHGLNQYDYAARYYDPGYGRFTSVDPMAEKFYSWSPYVYCYNNPMKFIDPDGKTPWWVALGVKGAIGGVIDIGVQFAVNRVMGQGIGDAVGNIDWTSVGTAAVLSASTFSGASEARKMRIMVAAVAGDALVDISINDGIETSKIIGGDKTIIDSSVDVATSVFPSKGSGALVDVLEKSIRSDLASSSARANIHIKKYFQNQLKVVTSDSFLYSVDAATSFVGGVVNEGTKGVSNTNNTSNTYLGISPLPSDNTKIKKEK